MTKENSDSNKSRTDRRTQLEEFKRKKKEESEKRVFKKPEVSSRSRQSAASKSPVICKNILEKSKSVSAKPLKRRILSDQMDLSGDKKRIKSVKPRELQCPKKIPSIEPLLSHPIPSFIFNCINSEIPRPWSNDVFWEKRRILVTVNDKNEIIQKTVIQRPHLQFFKLKCVSDLCALHYYSLALTILDILAAPRLPKSLDISLKPVFWISKAAIYEKLGNYEAAVNIYQEAISCEIGPSDNFQFAIKCLKERMQKNNYQLVTNISTNPFLIGKPAEIKVGDTLQDTSYLFQADDDSEFIPGLQETLDRAAGLSKTIVPVYPVDLTCSLKKPVDNFKRKSVSKAAKVIAETNMLFSPSNIDESKPELKSTETFLTPVRIRKNGSLEIAPDEMVLTPVRRSLRILSTNHYIEPHKISEIQQNFTYIPNGALPSNSKPFNFLPLKNSPKNNKKTQKELPKFPKEPSVEVPITFYHKKLTCPYPGKDKDLIVERIPASFVARTPTKRIRDLIEADIVLSPVAKNTKPGPDEIAYDTASDIQSPFKFYRMPDSDDGNIND